MSDLKIPNLNMNSEKYIFKKKLSLKRKSRKRLSIESGLMFILSLLIVYVNYLIPNKNLLLKNLPTTLNTSFSLLIDLFSKLYELFLIVYICLSSIIALILLIGCFYRLFKVYRRKSKQINYK